MATRLARLKSAQKAAGLKKKNTIKIPRNFALGAARYTKVSRRRSSCVIFLEFLANKNATELKIPPACFSFLINCHFQPPKRRFCSHGLKADLPGEGSGGARVTSQRCRGVLGLVFGSGGSSRFWERRGRGGRGPVGAFCSDAARGGGGRG